MALCETCKQLGKDECVIEAIVEKEIGPVFERIRRKATSLDDLLQITVSEQRIVRSLIRIAKKNNCPNAGKPFFPRKVIY